MISILGHRGASARRPENTIEAFLEAGRLGADGVELDVRRSADGALVVHHDARYGDGRVIAEVDAADRPSTVPDLAAALEACRGMLVNVEIKNVPTDPGYDPSEEMAVRVADLAVDPATPARILVSAFTLVTIDRVRERQPSVDTGWLTLASFDQHRALDTAAAHGHRALHPHHSVVTDRLVAAAHDAGLAVNTWTVDEDEDVRRVAAAGVDMIITNVPDRVRAVLGRSGYAG